MDSLSWIRSMRGPILAVLVSAAGWVFADAQAVRFYEDALTRFNAGDAKGALIQLRNALQRDPSQLSARVLMGQVQLELGNPRQAEEELLLANRLGADRALIALPLARARNRLGKYQAVVDELRPAEYPPAMQADLWTALGRARLGNRDPLGADLAFAEALKLAPGHEQAMLGRARGMIQQRRYGEVEPLAAEILERYPGNPEAWILMGSVYQARGELERAAAHHRQAVQLDPANQRAVLAEALALLGGGKADQAADLLQPLREAHPYSLEAHYFAHKALTELGRREEAAQALRQASDLVNAVTPGDLGGNSSLLLLAALVKTENAEYEGAYAFLSRYLENEPDDLGANKRLARLQMRINRPADAARLLVRLRANHPEDPELLVMLGDVNGGLQDYVAAERYYRLALEQLENNPALIGRLGLSQLRQGRTDAAIDTLRALVDQGPDANTGASVFLGILYLKEGRLEEARDIADRVVASQPDNLVALNLQATVAITQGQRDQGRGLLQAILARDAGFQPARFNLIKLDMLEGNHRAAAEALDGLLQADPDDQAALYEAARLAELQGDDAGAIVRLERVRRLNPRALRPILKLVDLYVASGRADDALQVAQALDREVPRHLQVKKALARVQLALGQTAMAQSLLADAAKLAGYRVDELTAVAGLQIRAEALEAAEATLRKAVAEQPDSTDARIELARLLARQGRYPAAVAEATAVAGSAPDNPVAIVLLGDLQLAQGETETALLHYRRAQPLVDTPQTIIRVHNALLRAGRDEEALAELRAWDSAHPETPAVMRVLADHLYRIGDAEGALQRYLRLAELSPDSFVVQNNLANMLLPVDGERALAAAQRAHELAPDNAAVLDTLGWILVQLGELERGLAHLREAVARSSHSPTILYHLAVALEEYGNRAEARRELQRALASTATFPEREDARQRLERLGPQ